MSGSPQPAVRALSSGPHRTCFAERRVCLLVREDGRLVALPTLAAAAGRARTLPRLLPALAGRAIAVGPDGRALLVASIEDGVLRIDRVSPRDVEPRRIRECRVPGDASPDPVGLGALVVAAVDEPRRWGPDRPVTLQAGEEVWRLEPTADSAVVLERGVRCFGPDLRGGCTWIASERGGSRVAHLGPTTSRPRAVSWPGTGPELLLGAARGRRRGPLPALRGAEGRWVLDAGGERECEVAPPAGARALAAAWSPRGGPEPELLLLLEDGLSLAVLRGGRLVAAGRLAATPDEVASSPAAPWVAMRRGAEVTVRELGRRPGRVLARWSASSWAELTAR